MWETGSLGTDIGDVNIVARGVGRQIRDVYIFGGVVPCGGFGVRHITLGMLKYWGRGPGGVTGGSGTAMGDMLIS